ncbi:arsenate reductase (glutaredoxin) [Glaciecola sp. MH2013]|uniref:ArsC/Spx/MgsR family protein n=1 Tax=Glaciecola sp. MH2013 TaxID=2785524 RepID=UPI00189FA9C1|nr:ArsC/Spx/MgsR family protein [Glaciecola sp. MH2013]MBF7072877.1 arsenate reductase (glutaredoxin) [Glaciecola sp. MH2013]
MSVFEKATLLHNPRCSKSRQAVEFLQQNNVKFDTREYLKVPLSKEEINYIFEASGLDHAAMMIRTKEKEYKEAGLSQDSSSESILQAIETYPKLIERPILLIKGQAAIGRPLDNIAALINS